MGIVAVCTTLEPVPFLSSSPRPLDGVVNVTVSGPGAPARTDWSWFKPELIAFATPTRAYTKLDGESVVVGVDVPWRSIAACCDVIVAVPFENPGADTVTTARI